MNEREKEDKLKELDQRFIKALKTQQKQAMDKELDKLKDIKNKKGKLKLSLP